MKQAKTIKTGAKIKKYKIKWAGHKLQWVKQKDQNAIKHSKHEL